MAGKPCEFFELRIQLPEHYSWRTSYQQDWHQMVVLDRSSRNAASWICILCECSVPYRMVSLNGKCNELRVRVVKDMVADVVRSSKE